jgi:hypothetical protein
MWYFSLRGGEGERGGCCFKRRKAGRVGLGRVSGGVGE